VSVYASAQHVHVPDAAVECVEKAPTRAVRPASGQHVHRSISWGTRLPDSRPTKTFVTFHQRPLIRLDLSTSLGPAASSEVHEPWTSLTLGWRINSVGVPQCLALSTSCRL
jgi:hypothetical protein